MWDEPLNAQVLHDPRSEIGRRSDDPLRDVPLGLQHSEHRSHFVGGDEVAGAVPLDLIEQSDTSDTGQRSNYIFTPVATSRGEDDVIPFLPPRPSDELLPLPRIQLVYQPAVLLH